MRQQLEQHDHQLLISVAEKYGVLLRHVVPLLLPFVERDEPLTEEEVLRFSALIVSRLAHAREEFQRESLRPFGTRPDAQEILYRIWQVQNDG